MPPRNPYLVNGRKTNRSSAKALSLGAPDDFDDFPLGHTEEPSANVQPVPVTVIFLDLFGSSREHFSVTRQEYLNQPDVLYERIDQFLLRDSDTSLHDVSGIRAEASDDASLGPYAPRIVYSKAALPAGVLDQARVVDLGLVGNREMNVREYISQQLQHLLAVDMLGMSAALGQRVPERHWMLSITACNMQFPKHWRSHH